MKTIKTRSLILFLLAWLVQYAALELAKPTSYQYFVVLIAVCISAILIAMKEL